MEKSNEGVVVPSESSNGTKPRVPPKRFIKNQIPDSIMHDAALNAAISLLPSNYNFEVHKCLWRIQTSGAKCVALQFPEGLLMFSLVLSDIFKNFGKLDDCFVLGDVTYGACCIDDFSATALGAQLLIHYGHSCLVPIDSTKIPSLYVFVEIKIEVDRLIDTIKLNIDTNEMKKLALAGTIQFSSAIRAAKPALESAGFEVLIPQSKPLSAGEVLGCTSPSLPKGVADVVVFVADGRFHLEAFMIANPAIKAFRYDPYLGVLFLEEYAHKEMKEVRKNAIIKAREAKNWGIILGTLGRQGNPRILERLQGRMRESGFAWTTILMSEISPTRIALFGNSVDAWVQIACPRLSIDWGEAFPKPLLTPFEAEIALGYIPGWWDRLTVQSNCNNGTSCESKYCCSYSSGQREANNGTVTDYPMDYYAQDGGKWNCTPSSRPSRPPRRNLRTCAVLVNTLWREGKTDEAVSVVEDMERRGIVGSASLYYDLARCLCSAGRCQDALLQIDKICKVANKPLIVIYTGLIQACLDMGNVQNGAYIFMQMHKFCSPNLVKCNIMLKGYLEHKMFDDARDIFQKMLDESCEINSRDDYKTRVLPDICTFNTMLTAPS